MCQRLFHRRTVDASLDVRLTELTTRLRNKLDGKYVAATLDIWSDRTMRGFLAVTGHFDDGGVVRTVLLGCHHFRGKCVIFAGTGFGQAGDGKMLFF